MCAVSATIDMYMRGFPYPHMIDYPKYVNDLAYAKELDVLTGEPDCSSSEKQEWHNQLVEYFNGPELGSNNAAVSAGGTAIGREPLLGKDSPTDG